MSDEQIVNSTRAGWDLLVNQARVIAMLPLEDWLRAINRADPFGAVLDSTLYREASRNMDAMKRLIEAALPLKRFVLSCQPSDDNREMSS